MNPKKTPAPRADKVKRLEDYDQTRPTQLSLFEMVEPQHRPYSRSVELYDFIPKYVWGKVERENGKYLPTLHREFECRGVRYKVNIHPARIEDPDGVFRDYYPSLREELIEDALRKLAVEGGSSFLDDAASVKFTLYQLQQELKRQGHSFSRNQIKTALSVCVGATMEVISEDGSTVLKSHPFETVGLRTWEDWKGTGQKTKCFVRFNPLVTASIKNLTFRRFNYEKTMSYRSVIARQLHKRLSHHYKQASYIDPNKRYTITLSTMMRDFGLTVYGQLRDNLRKATAAIEELKEKKVLWDYSIERILEPNTGHAKLIDAKFTLIPSPDFVSDTTRANEEQKNILQPQAIPPTMPRLPLR